MNQLEKALEAFKKGNIEEWIHLFLLGEGKNKELSDGLKKQKRYWVGPIEIELSKIPRVVGYESNLEYVENIESWNKRIGNMVCDLKIGWTPAPFITEYREGVLSLRDGNHRHGALEIFGYKKYWAVIWFNSEKDFNSWSIK